MKQNNIVSDVKDHLYLCYRELGPVIEANKKLLEVIATYERKTGNWPPIHLSKVHYEHSIRELRRRRQELSTAGHLLGRMGGRTT